MVIAFFLTFTSHYFNNTFYIISSKTPYIFNYFLQLHVTSTNSMKPMNFLDKESILEANFQGCLVYLVERQFNGRIYFHLKSYSIVTSLFVFVNVKNLKTMFILLIAMHCK